MITFRSKYVRLFRYAAVVIGATAGLLGIWVKHQAMRPEIPREARTVGVKFDTDVVMVTAESARDYHRCLVVFFSSLAAILVLGFAEKLFGADEDEEFTS